MEDKKYMEYREHMAEIIEIYNKEGILVVVEGINDKKALKKLGVDNVYMINPGPHYKVIDNLAEYKIVSLLTDLDKKGKQLYVLFKDQLNQYGVRIDERLRLCLARMKISHIEGL